MNLNGIKWYSLFCFAIILLAFLSCTKDWPEAPVEITRPEIISVSPDMWEFMVSTSTSISITFNEQMDLETIRDHASIMDADGNTVNGSWSSNGSTAIFTPSANLSMLSRYDVMIEGAYDEDQEWKGPGPQDVHGNSLYEDFTSHFATEGNYGASPIYVSAAPNLGDWSEIGRITDFEVETLGGFDAAQGIALNSDGSYLYVADRGGNAVMAVETAGFSIDGTVALPDSVEEPWIVGVTPNDNEVWALCRGTNHLVIIGTGTNTITNVIPLNGYCPNGGFLYRIAFSHDGSKAYITTRLSQSVLKINTATYEVETEKVIGEAAHIAEVTVSPDDAKVYVSNTWGLEPSIFVLDASADMPVIGTIDLPEEWGDAKKFTTYDNYLFVGMRWDAMIYKIDMTTDQVIGWTGWPDDWLGDWSDSENIAIDPEGEVIYQLCPDRGETAVFGTEELNFLGFIDTGTWWGIVSPQP
ncbi:MAG: hypothetical protein GWN00_18550 [Aliifodinibius sp.]|nr:hypothetical protein [Fodinibius sp.]NIV13071.1 hypothetical protein [Fodinibius sp.]NIY26731.1 hypothetical protein [Fodinibius sp.]